MRRFLSKFRLWSLPVANGGRVVRLPANQNASTIEQTYHGLPRITTDTPELGLPVFNFELRI
jgi:hypothetical protein